MGSSGAVCPTKRSKRILKDLQFIRDNYLEYLLGCNESEMKKADGMLSNIHDYIVEISAERKVLDAKVAEQIKKA